MKRHDPFWMVCGIGQGPPAHQHRTYTDAREEAKRLARENPGIRFVVLQAVEGYKVTSPFEIVEYDQVPF